LFILIPTSQTRVGNLFRHVSSIWVGQFSYDLIDGFVDLLFLADKRAEVTEELKRQDPAVKQAAIMSRLAELWRNCGPEIKQVCL
jgi:hypothetical protein